MICGFSGVQPRRFETLDASKIEQDRWLKFQSHLRPKFRSSQGCNPCCRRGLRFALGEPARVHQREQITRRARSGEVYFPNLYRAEVDD